MEVTSEPDVVSEIPADVVWIFVDDDAIAIPEPAVAEAETDFVRRHREREVVEPEAVASAAREQEHMTRTEAAREPPMRPRMLEHEMTRVRAVAVPAAALVHVRRSRRAARHAVVAGAGRAVMRNRNVMFTASLRERG